MILKELFLKCNVQEVLNKIIENYPDEACRINKYEDVIHKLQIIEPTPSPHREIPLTVYVAKITDPLFGDEYFDVSGHCFEENQDYACEYCPFSEWLSMYVSEPSLNHFGVASFLAHVLFEMTFLSFDENEISEIYQNLKEIEQAIIEGTCKTVSVNEVVKDFDDVEEEDTFDENKRKEISKNNNKIKAEMLGKQIKED